MASITASRIAQVAIPVEDIDRAKAFYADRLGLAHLFDAPPGLAFFQCGETRLMLSRAEGEGGGSSILYYAVPSARDAHAAMTVDGVAFLEEARCIAQVAGRDVWLAVGRDSEGNLFGVMSEEAPS
jgi:methylmalonyl-CoA/ethylmalonyl-CoA epimerase